MSCIELNPDRSRSVLSPPRGRGRRSGRPPRSKKGQQIVSVLLGNRWPAPPIASRRRTGRCCCATSMPYSPSLRFPVVAGRPQHRRCRRRRAWPPILGDGLRRRGPALHLGRRQPDVLANLRDACRYHRLGRAGQTRAAPRHGALGRLAVGAAGRLRGGDPIVTSKIARDYVGSNVWVTSEKAETKLGYTHRSAREGAGTQRALVSGSTATSPSRWPAASGAWSSARFERAAIPTPRRPWGPSRSGSCARYRPHCLRIKSKRVLFRAVTRAAAALVPVFERRWWWC